MKAQRLSLYENIREAAIKDDITPQILTWGDKPLQELFKKELSKHDKNVALIEQNIAAQPNILIALTDTYAACAPTIKSIIDTKHKREQFFTSMIASYDVYEDLLGKSTKGLEFYKKLQTNIQKLLARVRAARDVQDEERQQRLKSSQTVIPRDCNTTKSQAPKLRDYMKNGALPSVRPSPLGSETTTPASCPSAVNLPSSLYYDTAGGASVSNQTYSGYTNPMYQSSQYFTSHPEPPPAYTYLPPPQPNDPPPSYTPPISQSQWNQTAIGNLSLQSSQPQPASNSQDNQDSQNYYSNTYGNYQITANKQYVTKYDQSGATTSIATPLQQDQIPKSQNINNFYSYNMHPGYSYNPSTGDYNYASGYQFDSNSQQHLTASQYTIAGDVTPTNTTVSDQTFHQSQNSLAYNPVPTNNTTSYQSVVQQQHSNVNQPQEAPQSQLQIANQGTQPVVQSDGTTHEQANNYTIPYGSYNSTDVYSSTIQQPQNSINQMNYSSSSYGDTNAYNNTYMNSNNNIGTNTTNSTQFGKINLYALNIHNVLSCDLSLFC